MASMVDMPTHLTLVVALKADTLDPDNELGMHEDAYRAMVSQIGRWGEVVGATAGRASVKVADVVDAGAPPQVGDGKVPYPEAEPEVDPEAEARAESDRQYREKLASREA